MASDLRQPSDQPDRPVMTVELDSLLTEIDQDDRVAVVVFDSADPDFFLAHYDIAADQSAFDALPAARTPFHHWANVLIRPRPVTSGDDRRSAGRARGAGSEFAHRHRHPIRQSGAGRAGAVRGRVLRPCPGRPLDPSAGHRRSRAGVRDPARGDDFDGELAERYGYVNRAVPDAEFVGFVNAFAERVFAFDLLALADIKRLVNAASLPADAELTAEMDAFAEAVGRPTTPAIIRQALGQGFQQRSDVELNLGAYVGQSSTTCMVEQPTLLLVSGRAGMV